MKITRITIQKNDHKRFNLFGDDGQGERFLGGVHENVFVRHQLSKGMALTRAELQAILEEDEIERAMKLVLRYLTKRMRTEMEVRRRLAENEIREEVIEKTVASAKARGYVNDREYALSYVRTTRATTTKGPERIRQYLQEKGVASAQIAEVLQSFSNEEQIETIMKIIAKKEKESPKDSLLMRKKRLTQHLLQQGFQLPYIQTALQEGGLREVEEDEWAALDLQAEKASRKWKKNYEGAALKEKIKQSLYRKGFRLEMIEAWFRENINREDE